MGEVKYMNTFHSSKPPRYPVGAHVTLGNGVMSGNQKQSAGSPERYLPYQLPCREKLLLVLKGLYHIPAPQERCLHLLLPSCLCCGSSPLHSECLLYCALLSAEAEQMALSSESTD